MHEGFQGVIKDFEEVRNNFIFHETSQPMNVKHYREPPCWANPRWRHRSACYDWPLLVPSFFAQDLTQLLFSALRASQCSTFHGFLRKKKQFKELLRTCLLLLGTVDIFRHWTKKEFVHHEKRVHHENSSFTKYTIFSCHMNDSLRFHLIPDISNMDVKACFYPKTKELSLCAVRYTTWWRTDSNLSRGMV